MSSHRRPDPLAVATRELRRLAISSAVPTTYASRDSGGDAGDALAATSLEADAERRGYDEGYQRGLAAAAAHVERERQEHARANDTLAAGLAQAAAQLREAAERSRHDLQVAAPALAFALVEELLGRELQLASNPGRDALVRALALDDGHAPVSVRLHPEDLARLGDVARLELEREVAIVADPDVGPGGALLEAGETSVDARLASALERVRCALTGLTPTKVSDDRAA